MERLTSADLRSALDVLVEIQAAHDLDGFARAIPTLRRLIPSDVISYNELNPARQRVVVVADPPDVLTPAVIEGTRRTVAGHPALRYYQATGDGRALMLSDFWDRGQLQGSALYQECYRLVDGNHQLVCNLAGPDPFVVGLAFFRGRRAFSERERSLVDMLRPHLAAAYRAAEVRTVLDRVESALDTSGIQLMLLDGTDRVVHSSPRALELLGQLLFGRWPAGGRLPATLLAWLKQQRRQVSDGPGPRVAGRLMAQNDGRRLVATLVSGHAGDGGALLVEERELAPSAARLRGLGLSGRESEVLAELASGKTNGQIGRDLGVTPRTVRKHVESIFTKLNVETRTAAAAAAFSIGGRAG